ncbi:DUF5941 domain-containing protein [Actinoallomurus iriomotensis]|uniref:DUF5941 domain-containing protein n=1 Tax=Actinoallomurus iriomotensis TaxID=478107 RepID=A0A9W6W379_9ACTN|nr:hypothetical protein Airi02_070980 [Actinoallomurus iriomotensis]
MSTVLPGGMSAGAPERPTPNEAFTFHGDRLVAYRDDGPVSHVLGRLSGGQLPPLLPLLVAGIVTAILLIAGVNGQDSPAIFAPVLALLLCGPASTHPHSGRLDWLVPPIMRAIEYGYLATLCFAHDVSKPLTYAFIGILAYHHYDTVYRTRQRLWPAKWVFRAGLGWDGRLLIAAVATLAGVLPYVIAVLAVYLGLLFGIESVYTWTRTGTGKGVMVDLEDEGESPGGTAAQQEEEAAAEQAEAKQAEEALR